LIQNADVYEADFTDRFVDLRRSRFFSLTFNKKKVGIFFNFSVKNWENLELWIRISPYFHLSFSFYASPSD
jgi:hypothetical protein